MRAAPAVVLNAKRMTDFTSVDEGRHALSATHTHQVAVYTGASDIVYVDADASTEMVTDALRAWGFSVRAERENRHAASRGLESESTWTTTRPGWPPVNRLSNILSPVWLPTQAEDPGSTPPTSPNWFVRAA